MKVPPIYEYLMHVISTTLFLVFYIIVARDRMLSDIPKLKFMMVSLGLFITSLLILTPIKIFHPNHQFIKFLTPTLFIQQICSFLIFLTSFGLQIVMFRRSKYLENFQTDTNEINQQQSSVKLLQLTVQLVFLY